MTDDPAGRSSCRPGPVEWLFDGGGPILRYRVARDLMEDVDELELRELRKAAFACEESQRWLTNLRASQSIHGGFDHNAENPLAKLLEYGMDRSDPDFDAEVRRLLAGRLGPWDAFVLAPFLVRAGYMDHPLVREAFGERLAKLESTAIGGDFNLYLSSAEAAGVPKAWRGKPIYRDAFGHVGGYGLPTAYDFAAIGYMPLADPSTVQGLERIVGYLSDPRFQGTVGGYGWDRPNRRCYAAGRAFLACVEPCRLVLFLEWGAPFASARSSEWFQNGLSALEATRTESGTYRFPVAAMGERPGYYVYAGLHMGLGENRRRAEALELESTFRMLWIKRRMQASRPVESRA